MWTDPIVAKSRTYRSNFHCIVRPGCQLHVLPLGKEGTKLLYDVTSQERWTYVVIIDFQCALQTWPYIDYIHVQIMPHLLYILVHRMEMVDIITTIIHINIRLALS